jgi:hypothetical protein
MYTCATKHQHQQSGENLEKISELEKKFNMPQENPMARTESADNTSGSQWLYLLWSLYCWPWLAAAADKHPQPLNHIRL